MGTDAALFALKAKRYFYYDRDYNLMQVHDESPFVVTDAVQRLYDHRPVTAAQVRSVLVSHSSASATERGPGWQLALLRFVDAHQDDTFVRHTDSAEPSWHDVRAEGGFAEWRDAP